MRIVYALFLSLLLSTFLQAQSPDTLNKQMAPSPKTPADTAAIQKRIEVHSEIGINTKWRSVRDSIFYTKYNKYGDLKDDDTAYTPKKPWWFVGLKITAANVATTGADHYVLGYDYARVGFQSWNHNLKTGWEWDVYRFGMNFFFHPYSGAGYFNSARSSGYNFFQSIPFPFAGSLM